MATFTNLTKGQLMLTDENGRGVIFSANEKKVGLSNYFEKYTSTYSDSPLLSRTGALDGDGTVPVPVVDEENLVERPGNPNVYPVTRLADSSNLNPTNSASNRKKKLVWDSTADVADRQVDTRFCGIQEAPTKDRTETISTVTGLNGAKNFNITGTSGPIKVNGRRATAADAAANPAVSEGVFYTAFGTIEVVDDGSSDTGTFYFSIIGSGTHGSGSTFSFVAHADNTANIPTPNAASCVLDPDGTNYIALSAWTSGAAGDTADMTVNWVQLPEDGTTYNAVVPVATHVEGVFIQMQENNGTLFIVKDGKVMAIQGDALTTLS